MNEQESAQLLYIEAMAFVRSAALRAFVQLGLADEMDEATPVALPELARRTGAREDALMRLLRHLTGRGFVATHPTGYTLRPAVKALKSSSESPASSGILMFTDAMFWRTVHQLGENAKDPQPSFERYFGSPLAEYFAADPDIDALFYEGMATVSDNENESVIAACGLPATGTAVDVGGRNGSLLLAALQASHDLAGILFDKQGATDARRLDRHGESQRWRVEEGNFFTTVPNGDLLFLKRILHNWDDAQCVEILTNCRKALNPGGRILVIDAFIPDQAQHQGQLMDLMMLAACTGRERTIGEITPLCERAGLEVSRVLTTTSVVSIVEAVAAENGN